MVETTPEDRPPRVKEQSGRRAQKRRRLNVPLLAGTVVGLAVLGPTGYCWHAYQVRRIAGAWLEQADHRAAEEDWEGAASNVFRYLRVDRDSVDAKILLAEYYDKAAKDPRRKAQAVNFYYQALGVAPPERHPALRARVAELHLELTRFDPARFTLAEAEAKKLKDDDPDGWRLLGLSLYGHFRAGLLEAEPKPAAADAEPKWQKGTIGRASEGMTVGQVLQRALELNPGNVELSPIVAHVYREATELLGKEKRDLSTRRREQLADQVVDQMVRANPKNPEAVLARCRYRLGFKLQGAEDDLEAALKLGPDSPEVLWFAAERARQKAADASREGASLAEIRHYYDQARKHYEHLIKIGKADENTYLRLGQVCMARGDRAHAIKVWEQGLEEGAEESISLNGLLASAFLAEGDLVRAEKTLNVIEQASRRIMPRLRKAQSLALARSNSLLRGEWLARKGEYRKAIPLLRRVLEGQGTGGFELDALFRANWFLGAGHAALREWTLAARAYEEAAKVSGAREASRVADPRIAAARIAAATAWMAAGNPEKAVPQYEQALALENQPETWLGLARAHFQRQTNLPLEKRDWRLFEAALQAVKTPDPRTSRPLGNPWRLRLLEAEYAIAWGEEREKKEPGQQAKGVDEAMQLLRGAEDVYSSSAPLFRALALFYERLGFPADADRALEKLEKLAGQSADTFLLRSELYSRRGSYEKAREVLHEALKTVPAPFRFALEYRLIQITVQEGDFKRALQELTEIQAKYPSNVELTRQLAEIAFETGNLQGVERWEKKLRELEGSDGLYWRYYKARRLFRQAKDTKDSRFTEADELRGQLQRERPEWPGLRLLDGLAAQRRGDLRQAVEAYQEAIRLGERRAGIYGRVISLLYATQRFAEADRYLSELEDRGPLPSRLSSLQIRVAQAQGQLDRAIELARRQIDRQPKDAAAQIQLGQMLFAKSQAEEAEQDKAGLQEQAEQAFREAVRLAPGEARAYDKLFNYYLAVRNPDLAKKTLEEFAQEAKLPAVQLATVLGGDYERLGDREKAENHYREAERLAPNDIDALRPLADFLIRSRKVAEAERIWRRILRLAPQDGAARRNLAGILAALGGQEKWEEAQDLLEQADSPADRRLHAHLLPWRGGKANLQEAQRLLEQLVADSRNSVASDRLLLARLYEVDGNLRGARRQYVALVGRADANPAHLRSHIEFLLRHNLLKEAVGWIRKLEEEAPDQLSTVAMRARWLHRQGRTSEIETLVEPAAEKILKRLAADEQRQLQVALAVGTLYSTLGQHQAAQRWYRRLVDRDDPTAAHLALYIDVLLRSDSQDEADTWLKKLEEAAPGRLGTMMLRAKWLHQQARAAEIEPLVEALAKDLLEKLEGDDKRAAEAQLALSIGNVYSALDQHQAAERWYRRHKELAPEAYLPLAWSLAKQARTGDAIQVCVEAAKSDSSPQPALAAAAVVLEGDPTEDDLRLAESVFTNALKKHKDDTALLFQLANLRTMQDRYEDAIALYRRVLKLEPKHVSALNNLATLLGESTQPDKREEARRCIDQAVELDGPQAALLDTKGMTLFHDQKGDRAVECLEEAASAPDADPRYHFHLALAYHQVGRLGEARGALKKARDGGLGSTILTSTDRKLLSDLEQNLGQ